MKQNLLKLIAITTLLIGSMLISNESYSQTCTGGMIYQQTGLAKMIWFQDKASSNQGWNTDSTHWDFGDGSSDSGHTVLHTFPDTLIYHVKKSTRFSQPGNPSNFCIVVDSANVDASFLQQSGGCSVHFGLKVKWLTGLTYGVSSYYYGCPYDLREVAVDTGIYTSVTSGPVPIPGTQYTTNQYFFTYTLPSADDYQIIHHVSTPPSGGSGGGMWVCVSTIWKDSIPPTPSGCHASFFMAPDTNDINNWILYDYSSGSNLTYSWDFGDGSGSTQVSPTHTYAATGKYQVCLTVSNGSCSDTKCDTAYVDSLQLGQGMRTISVVNMHVGIDENSEANSGLHVYPNPSSAPVTFEAKIDMDELKIYNSLGGLVYVAAPHQKKFTPEKQLEPGIYLATIRSGSVAKTTKFIIE